MVYDVIDQVNGDRLKFRGFVYEWSSLEGRGIMRTNKKILDLATDQKTDTIKVSLRKCPNEKPPEMYREMQFYVIATVKGLEAVESVYVEPPYFHTPSADRNGRRTGYNNSRRLSQRGSSIVQAHPGPYSRSPGVMSERAGSAQRVTASKASLNKSQRARSIGAGEQKSAVEEEMRDGSAEFTFGGASRKKPVARGLSESKAMELQNKADEETERVCSVCRRYECNVVLSPCGHLGCCLCFSFNERCPLCDKRIESELPLRIWSSFKRSDPWTRQIAQKKRS